MENIKNSDLLDQNTPDFAQIPQNLVAFPTFSSDLLSILTQIQTQMAANPSYLDLPNCPYLPTTKAFLRNMFGVKTINSDDLQAEMDTFFGDKQMYDRIISDSKRAYMNLSNQMTKLEANNKIDDTIAFTKAITQMQERLLTIQEKAEGLKQIHEFKNIVLEVIATELNPDQRTAIMKRIEDIVKA